MEQLTVMLVNSTCKFKASVFCLVKMIVNIFSVMGLILVGDVYFLNPSLYLLLFLSYSLYPFHSVNILLSRLLKEEKFSNKVISSSSLPTLANNKVTGVTGES